MAPRNRLRTIFLKKAFFSNPLQNATFEEYIRDAINQLNGNLPDLDKSFFVRLHCSDLEVKKKEGIYLYFTQTFQGSETSTVNTFGDKSVSTLPPPNGTDFLERDLSLFITQNTIVSCNNGLSTSSLIQYFVALFNEAKLNDEVGIFDISNVAHNDNLKLIESVGVKNIDLDVQTYLATFEEIKSEYKNNFIQELFSKKDQEIIRHKENLRVRLIINPKKGLAKQTCENIQTPMKRLAKIAVDEHEDAYKITLKNGSQLTPTDISVHEKVSLSAFGNSVDHKRVWLELERVYNNYKNDPSIV